MIGKGKLVFFPNIVVSLVRTGLKEKEKSNIVTFRIPSFMNKFDLKEYLLKIYGLKCENMKIFNFAARKKSGNRRSGSRKNALVELSENFEIPKL